MPEADRVYLDEAGVEDTHCYAYGWSAQGERCPGERLGHRTQRVSMAAAWCCGTVLAPLTFEGYCDSVLIEAWFETQLCPVLRPGQVVRVPFGQGQRLISSPRASARVVRAGGLRTVAATTVLARPQQD